MTMKKFDAGNRTVVRTNRFSNSEFLFNDHMKTLPSDRATLAMDMAARWGMVAGKTDGEDRTGRAKLALLEPSEIVSRAIETADGIMTEIENRGWLDVMPTIDELYEETEE